MSAERATRAPLGSGLRPDVRLWTGIAAISVAILTLVEFGVQMAIGARPELSDETALAAYVTRVATPMLVIILIDTILMAAIVVFLGGFRQLITHARPDLQWITDLAFGAGLLFVGVTLVGDGMEGGAALDTVNATADPSVLRALTEGHMLMFGTIAVMLTAVVSAAAGYVTLASGAVPRWTGWIAVVVAVLNLLAVPTMFGGTSPKSFVSAGGPGVAIFATFPWLVWVVAVGIVCIRDRRRRPDADES